MGVNVLFLLLLFVEFEVWGGASGYGISLSHSDAGILSVFVCALCGFLCVCACVCVCVLVLAAPFLMPALLGAQQASSNLTDLLSRSSMWK